MIAVAVAAVVYGPKAAEGRLGSEIRDVAGPVLSETIRELLIRAHQPRAGVIATLLGLTAMAFGASSVFVELHDALNTIWDVPRHLDQTHAATIVRLVRHRFYSFAAVLGIGFLLLLSMVLNAGFEATGIFVPRATTFAILYLVIAALFMALYKILPDVSLKWSDVVAGALLASLLFSLGQQLIGAYFAVAGSGSAYGAAGSPIVVLLWVYYSAQLFFWGAEFSKVYTRTLGSHKRKLCT